MAFSAAQQTEFESEGRVFMVAVRPGQGFWFRFFTDAQNKRRGFCHMTLPTFNLSVENWLWTQFLPRTTNVQFFFARNKYRQCAVFVTKRQTFFVAKRFMMFSESSSRASRRSVESKLSHLSRNVVRLAESLLISSHSRRQRRGNVQQEAEWCDRPNQLFGL